MRIVGTNLDGAACDTLILTTNNSGTNSVIFPRSATLTGVVFTLTPGPGAIDTVKFILPTQVQCEDSVLITYRKKSACPGGTNNVTDPTMTFGAYDRVSVDYPQNDIYCLGDTNPTPIHLFEDPNFVILTGTASAMPNTATGQFIVHSGHVGTYTVRAFTNNVGMAYCNHADTVTVIIRANTASSVTYDPTPQCPTLDTLAPSATSPASGGTFSALPNVLVWSNAATGAIDLRSTPAGTYQIVYTPGHDFCRTPSNATVTVMAMATASFNYQANYCEGAPPAFPTISASPPGAFNWIPPGATSFLDMNASTGEINLNTSTPATYTVYYAPTGSCVDTTYDTLTIHPRPNTSFILPQDSLCENSPPTAAAIPPLPGRTFLSFDGVQVNPATGAINPAPPTPLGGPYYIICRDTLNGCPGSSQRPVFIFPDDSASIFYPLPGYCTNGVDPSPVFVYGSLGGTFTASGGPGNLSINQNTGVIDLSACTSGNYAISYILPNQECRDTVFVDSVEITQSNFSSFFLFGNGQRKIFPCEGSGLYPMISLGPPNADSVRYDVFGNGGSGTFPNAVVNDQLDANALPVGGPYLLVRTAYLGYCFDTIQGWVTIQEQDEAAFYFVTNPVCESASDPLPLIQGTGGGTFTAPSLVINPTTGAVDLDLSNDGNHMIIYSTPIGNPCPDSDTTTLTILSASSADFDYGGTTHCSSDSTIITPTGQVFGGLFSTTPNTGLVIDDSTGVITVQGSLPGTYTINYAISNAACQVQNSEQLTLIQADTSTTMVYADSVFCPNDPNPTPVIIGDTTGTFLGVSGLSFANSADGTISLLNSRPDSLNPYEIRYQLNGQCPVILRDTITILPLTQSYFAFIPPTICTTDPTPWPDSLPLIGSGTFFMQNTFSDTLPWITPDSGRILMDSINQTGAQFFVTFVPFNTCSEPHTELIAVNIGPENASVSPFPDTTICAGASLPIYGLNADEFQWFRNDTAVNPANIRPGFIQMNDFQSGDRVLAVASNAGGLCRDSFLVTVFVDPNPTVTVLDLDQIISSNQPVEIQIGTTVDSTTLHWTANSNGNVTFDRDADSIPGVMAGVSGLLQSFVTLNDSGSPAQIVYIVTPISNGCRGDTIHIPINVNPGDNPIFIPQVMTPNGDDLNDTWLIQWRTDVNPADFTMLLYNRSGGMVLEMNGLRNDFNGETLPDGVYWWNLLNRQNGSVAKGGLTIRRK